MGTQISNVAVMVNNEIVAIKPNTLAFTEGFGEQEIMGAAAGGSQIEQIFSDDIETHFSMVKFDLPSTISNIKAARTWKANGNANLVQISARVAGENMTRSFTQAAVTGDYEVGLGSDQVISLEFKSNAAI